MAGKTKELAQAVTGAATPTQAPVPYPQMNFPAAMPGQLQMIADQLGQGFGQNPAEILAYLQSFNKPVSTSTPAQANAGPTKTYTRTARDANGNAISQESTSQDFGNDPRYQDLQWRYT